MTFPTPSEALQSGKEALLYKIAQSINNCELDIILNWFEFTLLNNTDIHENLKNSGWSFKTTKFIKQLGYSSFGSMGLSDAIPIGSTYYILSLCVNK